MHLDSNSNYFTIFDGATSYEFALWVKENFNPNFASVAMSKQCCET